MILFCSQIILLKTYFPCLTHTLTGQILFCYGKPCAHVETPKDYFRQLFNIPIPYFIKRPARAACLSVGENQAPLAPRFIFLIYDYMTVGRNLFKFGRCMQ